MAIQGVNRGVPRKYVRMSSILQFEGGSQSIPWEHGSFPDVVKPQVEHANSLHADSTASMRRAPIPGQHKLSSMSANINFKYVHHRAVNLKESM